MKTRNLLLALALSAAVGATGCRDNAADRTGELESPQPTTAETGGTDASGTETDTPQENPAAPTATATDLTTTDSNPVP